MRDGEFALGQVSIRQSLPFAGEVEYWSIQGYALADPNAVQLRFSGYHGALKGGSDVALGTSAEQRVIVGVRAGSSSTPTIHRVRMSPLRHPDASMTIPGHSPTQVRPGVVIAPNLQTGERALVPRPLPLRIDVKPPAPRPTFMSNSTPKPAISPTR